MIPDSLAPGIVIRAPDKTSVRQSGDEVRLDGVLRLCACVLSSSSFERDLNRNTSVWYFTSLQTRWACDATLATRTL